MRISKRRLGYNPGGPSLALALPLALGVFFLTLAGCAERAREAGTPRAMAHNPVHHFGELPNDREVTHRFSIANAGSGSLELRSMVASCGCTAAAPSSRWIPPGETGHIDVILRLRGRAGAQDAVIAVSTNDPAAPSLQLRVQGRALPAVALIPEHIDFGRLLDDQVQRRVLVARVQDPGVTVRISGIAPPGSPFEARIAEPMPGDGTMEWPITVTTNPAIPTGPHHATIRLATSHPELPELQAHIRAESAPPIEVAPPVLLVPLYDAIDPPRTSQFVHLTGGRIKDFEIERIEAPVEDMGVDFVKQAEGQFQIRLTGLPTDGRLRDTDLVIHTNQAESGEIRVPFRSLPTEPRNASGE